jgi:hypothetical protein
VETIDPLVVAMQALLQTSMQDTSKIFAQLNADLSKLSNYTTSHNIPNRYKDTASESHSRSQEEQNKRFGSNSPDWVFDKPIDSQET